MCRILTAAATCYTRFPTVQFYTASQLVCDSLLSPMQAGSPKKGQAPMEEAGQPAQAEAGA